MNGLGQQPIEQVNWNEWRPLETPSDFSGAAVYEVRIVDDSGSPFSVPRMLLNDDGGLLSIGEAGNMEIRRRQCIDGTRKGVGHSSYNLLNSVLQHTNFRERFPRFSLQYRFCITIDKQSAQTLESKLIKDYILRFGEPPPLNSEIPDRYGGWPGADLSGWE